MNFVILTSDEMAPIENVQNLNTGHAISDYYYFFNLKKSNWNYAFVSNSLIPGFQTIGETPFNDICIISDHNVDLFAGKQIKNAYIMGGYEIFEKIVGNVSGFIEFKIGDTLPDFKLVADLIYKMKDKAPLVKNINAFTTPEKFSMWGVDTLFVDCDGWVYYHPSFYYQQKECGKIGKLDQITDEALHFSKPHLICATCETFYCDRDIYSNKILTGEYMVPCKASCARTTEITNISKELFNKLVGEAVFEAQDLDRVDSFKGQDEYDRLAAGRIRCNCIKGISFQDRMLRGEA